MELHYVKIEEDWDDLKDESSVTFDLPTKEICYKIFNPSSNGRWWLSHAAYNGEIFNVLEIESHSFVESVVGYPCRGNFPEVRSLDDLKKVIKALDDECVKKFGTPDSESKSKPKFKIGDKVRILPRKGSSRDYRSNYKDDMLDCGGKTTTIVSCKPTNLVARKWPDDGYVYKLEDFSWSWNSSMLELVEDSDSKEKYIHPSKLKDGDFIKIENATNASYIYIFKEYKDSYIERYASFDLEMHELSTESYRHWYYSDENTKITYATEEERKLLLEALAKEGYYWNFGANALVPVETITLAKSISVDTVQPIKNIIKAYPIKILAVEEDSDELNLFPTKKHYQLNFNY